jgi:hypothetical protein
MHHPYQQLNECEQAKDIRQIELDGALPVLGSAIQRRQHPTETNPGTQQQDADKQ